MSRHWHLIRTGFRGSGHSTAAPLNPLNLIDSGRFEVKTANATIFVAPEQSYLLETRVIDGRKYLTIPVEEEIEVNGFGVCTQGEKQG